MFEEGIVAASSIMCGGQPCSLAPRPHSAASGACWTSRSTVATRPSGTRRLPEAEGSDGRASEGHAVEQTSCHRRSSDASCWSHMGCALRGAGGLGSHAACSRSVKTISSQHGEDFRSGSANFGRPDPATLGGPQEPSQAYSDSKACDVALALAWGRRRPGVASAAVDPAGLRPNWPAPALPVMSHRPRTPSATAAPRPIWLPPRTGRTGRQRQFRGI